MGERRLYPSKILPEVMEDPAAPRDKFDPVVVTYIYKRECDVLFGELLLYAKAYKDTRRTLDALIAKGVVKAEHLRAVSEELYPERAAKIREFDERMGLACTTIDEIGLDEAEANAMIRWAVHGEYLPPDEAMREWEAITAQQPNAA